MGLARLIPRADPASWQRSFMKEDLARRQVAPHVRAQLEARIDNGGLSMPDYLRLWEQFGFNGVQYVIPGGNIVEMTALQAQRSSIVASCIKVRQQVFSEIRFAFQQRSAGQFGKLFGTPALGILEEPWPFASTSDLLSRMELDASLYGNSYWVMSAPSQIDAGPITVPSYGTKMLTRLDPTCVHILTADVDDDITGKGYGKQLIGYVVRDRKNQEVATFAPDEVIHYRPQPDPKHEYRGLSWLGSLLPDVIADLDLTDYIHSFVGNAATPNLVVAFTDPIGKAAMKEFVDTMESAHTGPQAATKNLYVGSGVDVKVVGSNFANMELAITQSHGETRICAAAGVPVALLGLSEGLKGSALNAGNFASLRRLFADVQIRPNWRAACAALSTLVPPPPGARLWYDDRDVPFLSADITDASQIRTNDSSTMLNLVNAGYDPDSATQAILAGDWTLLKHTGIASVQLQPNTIEAIEKGEAQATSGPVPPPATPKGPVKTPAPAGPDPDSEPEPGENPNE